MLLPNGTPIPPSQFATKIPNKKALMEFFERHCSKYLPPAREMTMEFARDILSGKKHLLDMKDVKWVTKAPQLKDLNVKYIWSVIRRKQHLMKFFPSYTGKKFPTKAYLFNVVNTIEAGSIVKLIRQKIEERKKEKEKIENPIIIAPNWMQKMMNFQTIQSDQTIQRLNGLVKRSTKQCVICHHDINLNANQYFYDC